MNSERLAPKRVVMLGATGTIGRATVRALVRHGHAVKCLVRPGTPTSAVPAGVSIHECNVSDPLSIREALGSDRFDAMVSCMASRTGVASDAWAVDHQAHLHLLDAAKGHGATQFVLLSAICVQKPRLAFQHAKLAFEKELMGSGLTWSIVRPTAYFKSLSGQIERVRQGKTFLLFGDGALTACKPISDDDCAEYIAGCLRDADRWNRVLPIGGPGMAITPREQGKLLFTIAGKPARFTSVPLVLLDVIAGALSALSVVIPPLREKAEYAKIGRYYASESMLVWDAERGRYDAAATPSFGTQTLAEHYRALLK